MAAVRRQRCCISSSRHPMDGGLICMTMKNRICLLTVLCVCLVFNFTPVVLSQYYGQPEQVHISLGGDPTQMVVTWSTVNRTALSVVEYGTRVSDKLRLQSHTSTQTVFVDGGPLHRTQYIHRVWLNSLLPDTCYVYHCGSPEAGWSDEFTFTTLQSGRNWSPRVVLYGDLGNVNPQSLPRLQEDVTKGMYHIALHVGDFAYDMATNNAKVGDEFMRQIEPIAANVPYMTCPGNHEHVYNFSNYRNRFTMPGDEFSDNMFFSFNIGPAKVLSFNTEYYFPYPGFGVEQISKQYNWLEAELMEANKPENRAERPWLLTIGHKPMYCSNADDDDCTKFESLIRTGMNGTHAYALEQLFYKYGVDLILGAHEHSYERLWPVYNRKVYNGSKSEPYTNPNAPVHIITGSAGCFSRHDPFKSKFQSWSAFHSLDYGYTRMIIHNDTHLYLEQVSDDQDGAVIDKMTLIKDYHGPYHR